MACSCTTTRERIAVFPIKEELMLQCEALFFTVEGLKALITTFVHQTEFPIDRERFNSLRDEYLTAYSELSITLRTLQHAAVPEEFLTQDFDVEADFEFSSFVVYKKGC